jgi:hypothetical protein
LASHAPGLSKAPPKRVKSIHLNGIRKREAGPTQGSNNIEAGQLRDDGGHWMDTRTIPETREARMDDDLRDP